MHTGGMSTTKVNVTTCDLCGYGGAWTRPEDFHAFGDVDLCRWCADDRPVTRMECGGHVVTFSAESWECSCGERYVRPFFLPAKVRAAVPNMLNATASIHVEGR